MTILVVVMMVMMMITKKFLIKISSWVNIILRNWEAQDSMRHWKVQL